MKKPKTDPQKDCVSFQDAFTRIDLLQQPGMKVKYFKFIVVSPEGNKMTLTFDPSKLKK